MKLPSDISDNELIKKQPENEKKWLKLFLKAAGLLIGILLIAWFVKQSDPVVIWSQLKQININFVYLILVTFIAYFMVSIAWKQSFLKKPSNISITQFFIIRLIGESLAQINPTNVIAGETLKAVILKKMGVPYKDSIVSLTISRFLIILSGVSMILIGIVIFFDYLDVLGSKGSIIIIIAGIFALLLSLLYLFHTGKGIFILPIYILNKFFQGSNKISSIIGKLTEIDSELIEFYRTKKLNFLSAFTLSFLHRVAGAMEFYVILYFLGIDISILACIAVEVGVAAFKSLGSFVPGQIGFEEYGNKMMLEFVNVSGSEVWITVSILKRARQLFWIAAGIIAFYFIMKTSNNFTTKTREIENGSFIYHS